MSENSSYRTEKKQSGRLAPGLWTQMKENAKRRLWLFALLTFVMLLCYPLMAALRLNRYAGSDDMSSLIMRQGIGHNTLGLVGGMTVFLMTVCGVVCALEGFSWIYSRKKADMYLCQPITAGRRFLMTYLNGVLLCFIPYTVSAILAFLVIAGAGAATPAHLVNLLFTIPAALVYFLAVYNLTLIAMMISGRIGMAGFFILMGFLYDPLMRFLLESYCSSYFSTYAGIVESRQFISPILRMVNMLDQSFLPWGTEAVTAGGLAEKVIRPLLPGLFALLAEAVLFGAAAYICYKKRPMEAAARAVAFETVKGPVKVLLMVFTGLLGSACFRDISGNDGFFVAVCGLLLGMLFSQALLEIVYEGDLKAFAGHRKAFAVGAAATIAVYLFFALDVSGYDTWVPKQDEVENAAIEIYFCNKYRFSYVDEEGVPGWDNRRELDTMKMTDVSSVLSLAGDGMKRGGEEADDASRLLCRVKYHLKNGKDKYRDFYIDYEKEKTVLDILFANQDYKEGANQVLSPQMDKIFECSSVYYNNGMQEKEIVDKSALPLMRAYQKDVREMSFTDVKDALPCGMICLRCRIRDMEEYLLEYPVFPSYTRTVEYLRGKNMELYLKIDPQAVESIRLVRYGEEDAEIIEKGTFFGTSAVSTQKTKAVEKEYTKKEQISELLTCIYPATLSGWSYLEDDRGDRSGMQPGVYVEVHEADNDTAWNYNWNNGFTIKGGELPEFVKKDLKIE